VAPAVGLTTIPILGFDTRSALPLAEKCGVAFQLTNILRDIREMPGAAVFTFPPKTRTALASPRTTFAPATAATPFCG